MDSLRRSRAQDEMLLLVHGSRIVLASPAFLHATGFTRGEITSPEFRLRHVIEGEVRSSLSPVEIHAMRGGRVPAKAFSRSLGGDLQAILLVQGDVDEASLPTRSVRALASAMRSEIAAAQSVMRRLDERLAWLEHAHVEHVDAHTDRLVGLLEGIARLAEAGEDVARLSARLDLERPMDVVR